MDILKGRLSPAASIKGTLSASVGLKGKLSVPMYVGGDIYRGSYEVTPLAYLDQTLETRNKFLEDDVTVLKVPYYETSNIYDGKTVFIAEDINNG